MRLLLLAVLAVLLAGCGGTETVTQTVTETETTTETVTTEAATPPPTDTDATSTETDASADTRPPAEPLPEGVIGLDGTYILTEDDSDCSGFNFNCGPIEENRFEDEDAERRARATTTCTSATACTVRFGLGLDTGGEKIYELEADPDRKGTYVGTATGEAGCGPDDAPRTTKERVSARAASTSDATGRLVADRLDVFVTLRVKCSVSGGDENVKSAFTFRGNLRK